MVTPSMTCHKILLVDDNQELAGLLARLVEGEGWEPVLCGRGKAAIEAVLAEAPAVAVVDVLLPDMMGYEVGAALRRAGVPFILMTGIFKGSRAGSEARVQHGAAGYFEKPFEARKLLDAVRGLLPAEPPSRPPPPARTRARERAAEDLDLELAVESDEPADALDLTGKVEVSEGGTVSAVIRGERLQAAAFAGRREAARPQSPRVVPVLSPVVPAPSPPAARPSPDAALRPAAPAAAAATRREPPAEGELRDNLPELVTAFWLAQQTGELALQRGEVKKAVYFDRGRPCFAVSNLVADRFGPFLVRVGKLTQAQLELCQAAADTTGRALSDVLLEMRLLEPAEKLYLMAQSVKSIAYSLFGWEEGRYRLHFTDRAARELTKVDFEPARLIARGVKKLYRPERLARLLAPGDRLVPTQEPAYPLHGVELELWEAKLLPHVDGTRTLAELCALAHRPEEAVRASLWSLVALEILEKRSA